MQSFRILYHSFLFRLTFLVGLGTATIATTNTARLHVYVFGYEMIS